MKPTYLKSLIFFCSITIFISCSKDDTSNPIVPTTDNIYLSKEIVSEYYDRWYSWNINYFYDNLNRPLKIVYSGDFHYTTEYSYNTDGTLLKIIDKNSTEEYRYKNQKLAFIITQGSQSIDTAFFNYNNSGVLISSEQKGWRGSLYNLPVLVKYSFDSKGYLLSRAENNIVIGNETLYDSTFYTWNANGNLTVLTEVTNTFVGRQQKIIYTYEYDDKINYQKAIHYPKELLFVMGLSQNWICTNNCILEKVTNSIGEPYSNAFKIPDYSTSNYPLKIVGEHSTIQLEYIEK
jgi:hypothetical protein